MVLINKALNEMTAKLVYYGPGLCGKTTNLEKIHTDPKVENKGKMISMSTETDRTLFFDFMPLELGTIRGHKVRVQLYTVPGQVFYDATRKLVLRGADGVVFVADSQASMRGSNLESLENLKANLRLNRIDPDKIAIVFQYNKRDVPTAESVEEMTSYLHPGNAPVVEAIAFKSIGVKATLRAAIGRILENLKNDVDVTLYTDTALAAPDMKARSGVTSGSAGTPKIGVGGRSMAVGTPLRASSAPPTPAAAPAAAPRPRPVAVPEPAPEVPNIAADPFGEPSDAMAVEQDESLFGHEPESSPFAPASDHASASHAESSPFDLDVSAEDLGATPVDGSYAASAHFDAPQFNAQVTAEVDAEIESTLEPAFDTEAEADELELSAGPSSDSTFSPGEDAPLPFSFLQEETPFDTAAEPESEASAAMEFDPLAEEDPEEFPAAPVEDEPGFQPTFEDPPLDEPEPDAPPPHQQTDGLLDRAQLQAMHESAQQLVHSLEAALENARTHARQLGEKLVH